MKANAHAALWLVLVKSHTQYIFNLWSVLGRHAKLTEVVGDLSHWLFSPTDQCKTETDLGNTTGSHML